MKNVDCYRGIDRTLNPRWAVWGAEGGQVKPLYDAKPDFKNPIATDIQPFEEGVQFSFAGQTFCLDSNWTLWALVDEDSGQYQKVIHLETDWIHQGELRNKVRTNWKTGEVIVRRKLANSWCAVEDIQLVPPRPQASNDPNS